MSTCYDGNMENNNNIYILTRVVPPDIRLTGYLAFLISGIRPDVRFHLPDIRLEKLFKIKTSYRISGQISIRYNPNFDRTHHL